MTKGLIKVVQNKIYFEVENFLSHLTRGFDTESVLRNTLASFGETAPDDVSRLGRNI